MTSQELSGYLKDLQEQIQAGLTNDFVLKDGIEIELSVISKKDLGGGFKIFVAEGSGKYQKEELSKIKFAIRRRITGRAVIPLRTTNY